MPQHLLLYRMLSEDASVFLENMEKIYIRNRISSKQPPCILFPEYRRLRNAGAAGREKEFRNRPEQVITKERKNEYAVDLACAFLRCDEGPS